MSRSDWNEFTEDYAERIFYERRDFEEFLERDVTDEEWFEFRERLLNTTVGHSGLKELPLDYPQSIELEYDDNMSKEEWWEFSETFWDMMSELILDYME